MPEIERWASLGEVSAQVHTALVVDDAPAAIEFARHALAEIHITIRSAKDGGQAQASFTMHRPDIVILDVILPGESGFEICERFKQADETVPIVMVSAIDSDEARALASRVGADAYLTKPVTREQLQETVRKAADAVWRRTKLGETEKTETDQDRIRFVCSCGKRFKVSVAHRGRSLTCPQCGEILVVPRRSV